MIEEARAAGATIGREPAETFWGGYSAVFLDPDGHPWEIAHNPHWTVTEDGGVRLQLRPSTADWPVNQDVGDPDSLPPDFSSIEGETE